MTIIVLIGIVLAFCSGCSKKDAVTIKDIVFSSNYEITAALNPEENQLEYTARVQIRNDGHDKTDELFFHLYGNLYKTETESISINSITDADRKAISYELRDNDQLIRLALDDKLKGGDETTVIFTCTVSIPAIESVYGVSRYGEIHLPFFYPQLAVYDKNGWNTKPLVSAGDGRYAEMSDYAITISAPSEYEIVCNGVEMSKGTQNGRTVYVFQADQRRELFIAAYTDYVHMERVVGNTRILGYFMNRNADLFDMENCIDAAAFSIGFYNRIYMSFPYETLIVMDSPWSRVPANMEYSGLFTIADMHGDAGEETTFHEMAHQWFYFLVGNNENTEPWLDEGFATFSQILCVEAAIQDETYKTVWDQEGYERRCEHTKRMSNEVSGVINVGYGETNRDSDLFYNRGASFLIELMETIGKDEFLSILSEYCKAYAFRIATTEDFLDLLRERAPADVEEIVKRYIQ